MEHSVGNEAPKHPKQAFQVERLAFFSDAVFAIAITLLIMDFKVPHITKDSTYEQVWKQLDDLKLNLGALLMTYYLICIYWMRHHFLYKYIHNYNNRIVVANMIAMLPIIFLPFSTAFLAESAESKDVAMLGFQLFLVNHFAASIAIFAIYWLGMVRHKEMSYEVPVDEKLKFYEQTLFSSIMMLVMFVATLFTTNLTTIELVIVACVILRVISMRLLKRKFGKSVA